jgi:hypothetical protein
MIVEFERCGYNLKKARNKALEFLMDTLLKDTCISVLVMVPVFVAAACSNRYGTTIVYTGLTAVFMFVCFCVVSAAAEYLMVLRNSYAKLQKADSISMTGREFNTLNACAMDCSAFSEILKINLEYFMEIEQPLTHYIYVSLADTYMCYICAVSRLDYC